MNIPNGRTARVDILVEGSLTSTGGGVRSSCTLIRDGDRTIVVDPGIHAGHFPNAAIHDHWAVYRGIDWEDSDADGRVLTSSVVLARTPGHTPEDISTIVGTPAGIVVCTHTWFNAETTVDDEDPEDAGQLHASRAGILEIANRIVPGHGAAFEPSESTAR